MGARKRNGMRKGEGSEGKVEAYANAKASEKDDDNSTTNEKQQT